MNVITENKENIEKILQSIKKDAVAIFEDSIMGTRLFIMKDAIGSLYGYLYRKDKETGKDVVRMIDLRCQLLKFVKNTMTVVQSPPSLYHVWHICLCDACENYGGRIFSHSQGDWDSHLRFVDNDKVFNFRIINEP